MSQKQAVATVQFSLSASTFGVWWTHNSIDKPDPTYFEHLNDPANQDGFNWQTVNFTFNYKNQFEGTIIVDNQYYTYFKLVDAKDANFKNKYYLVESVSKAFNGGYELQLRLDVFTTYGLDFWTNGVKNPEINTKTVNLNRTNHGQLLLDYYYEYNDQIFDGSYSNWTFHDPLLDFKSCPEIVGLINYFSTDHGATSPTRGKKFWPVFNLALWYKFTWNGSSWSTTATGFDVGFNIMGNTTSGNWRMLCLSTVRYYVFKPLIGDNDQYWLIWNTSPRQWFETTTNGITRFNALNNDASKSFNVRTDYEAIHKTFINSTKGFANKLIGVFQGPPLFFFSGEYINQYMVENSIASFDGTAFILSKIYITPDKYATKKWEYNSQFKNDKKLTLLSLMDNRNDYPHLPNEKYGLARSFFLITNEIVYWNNQLSEIMPPKNNKYIIQKMLWNDLQILPIAPKDICPKIEYGDANLKNGITSEPLGLISFSNILFLTNSGFRFGTADNKIGPSNTLWIFPSSLPVATDEYANYMTSALINQNNSMAIAKQERDLSIARHATAGISALFSGNIGGAIAGVANSAINIAGDVLQYQNKQKTYDAQNSANRATLGVNINSSIDIDTARQEMSSSTYNNNQSLSWLYYFLSFNWGVILKFPTMAKDICYYNNLVYLNGFYINAPVSIGSLALDWNNHSLEEPDLMPHLYYDFDIGSEILKYHYKTINLDLLNAITVLFNNGIRFWAGFPNYDKPWYWLNQGTYN